MPVISVERLIDNRALAIRDFHTQVGIPKAELDLSGGIDSAVMACLLRIALSPENVILVHSRCGTDRVQTIQATQLAKSLSIPLINVDINGVFGRLEDECQWAIVAAYGKGEDPEEIWREIETRQENDRTIMGSIRSTLRATVGRGINRLMGGGIRHGTGNECEDRFLRFYQKGGDGEVDTNPLAMLSKTEVYQLAFGLGRRLGLEVAAALKPIIDAEPTPDLWGSAQQTDEAELLSWTGARFTYGRIDSDTGKIKSIGTIERVARFFDQNPLVEKLLFYERSYNEEANSHIPLIAVASGEFGMIPQEEIKALLRGARKAERATRHKANPNIPTLGTRKELLAQRILTNDLCVEE